MLKVNFSKKQLDPIIQKYGINIDEDPVFEEILTMFDGKPNYQLWAVKTVYSGSANFYELQSIKHWCDNHHNLLSKLKKNGNVICYKTRSDIDDLLEEIEGLNKISYIKSIINKFNTQQRKMLYDVTKIDELDGLAAHTNHTFLKWYGALSKFEQLSDFTKSKCIKRMSPVDDRSMLYQMLIDATDESYEWNKEDLLEFVRTTTPHCDVVVNDGNTVVLDVKSYRDSKKLCYGRTNWCITSSEYRWDDYVTDIHSKQYFLFDFSKDEEDPFAHVGFTITKNGGFYAAHANGDEDILESSIDYHGKSANIKDALHGAGLSIGHFIPVKDSKFYKWDIDSFKRCLERHKEDVKFACEVNNVIVAEPLNLQGLKYLCSSNMISKKMKWPFDEGSDVKMFVFFDFNKAKNDDMSIVAVAYRSDDWGTYSIDTTIDLFGLRLPYNTNHPMDMGIKESLFINTESINKSVYLHKLIFESREEEAIEMVENPVVDVNMLFKDRLPIFAAVDNKMFKLAEKIIDSPNFDYNKLDGFGENFIQNMLYSCYLDCTFKPTKENRTLVMKIIKKVIESGKLNVNHVDDNGDTIINIAATNSQMYWLVEMLAKNKSVSLNARNDIGWTALGNAIRKKNVAAIKVLGQRSDLTVTKEDISLATSNGIDLSEYLASVQSQTDVVQVVKTDRKPAKSIKAYKSSH